MQWRRSGGLRMMVLAWCLLGAMTAFAQPTEVSPPPPPELIPELAPELAAEPTPAPDAARPAVASNELRSPRATMTTFLDAIVALRHFDVDESAQWARVAATMDLSQIDVDELQPRAWQLLEVLDKLGTVDVNTLPDVKAVEDSGVARYVYFPRSAADSGLWEQLVPFGLWPQGSVVMVRGPDRLWRFSAATVAGIDALHESMAPLPPRHIAPQPGVEEPEILGLLGATFAMTPWWGWLNLAGAIFLGLLLGKIAQAMLRGSANRLGERHWTFRATVLKDAASPASLMLLALGLSIGLTFIHMDERVGTLARQVVVFLYLLAAGWFAYNLIELVDIVLRRGAERTDSKLDDMIVPLIRKTLRIFMVIVFAIVVLENVFKLNITGFLAGLGIAGLAISLAAQDSVKNLFGSLTVFFDKPFAVGDFISFNGHVGGVEEIGFRSTRIRLLSGHLVTVPNMQFIDSPVENISARPAIRREMNVTITYDTPPDKIEQAVQIIRDILNDAAIIEEGRFDMEKSPPRVAFNDFNADSLNIKVFYWYQMAGDKDRGFFTFMQHAQMVNTKLFAAYGEAGIEFAFPTQTLYLAGDPARKLVVNVSKDAE